MRRCGRGGPTEDRKARLRAAQAQSITIHELSEQWMGEFVIPKLKPRTQTDYRQLLARPPPPLLGTLAVAEIDRRHIEQRHVAMATTPQAGQLCPCRHQGDVDLRR